ncbi:MAG: HIT domain-containing protein [Spirochaetes bacterium]|nr:HIT domain-containing protein [Spirochaetota bacterium]
MSVKRNYLFNTNKLNYVKGDKPDVDCILCTIAERSSKTELLEVYRTKKFIISVNLYPYNPGHLMIFPIKHIEDYGKLTDKDALEMHRLTVKTLSILKDEFNPSGFNIGYNIGKFSGASIQHIHQHIVPRYGNEAGFIDILAGTRLFVIDPVEIMNRLKKRFIALKPKR